MDSHRVFMKNFNWWCIQTIKKLQWYKENVKWRGLYENYKIGNDVKSEI